MVLNSGGYNPGNRLFVLNFDPASGRLTMAAAFRDAGSDRAGISLNDKT